MILNLINGEETRWGILNWPPIPSLNLPSASQCEAANFAFITRLRAFVDGFIQTGIDGSGVETPSSRRVRASVGCGRSTKNLISRIGEFDMGAPQ